MKNLKVTQKLILSFMIVIVFSVIIGSAGIVGMRKINIADNDLYNHNYLPTVMAGNISYQIVIQRVCLRNFVIYDINIDSKEFTSAKDSLNTSKAEMDKLISEYSKTILSSEDQDTYNEFVKAYNNEWMPMVDSVYSLGEANQMQEAKKALTEASQIAARINDLTTKLQNVKLSDGKDMVDNNSSLFVTMTVIESVVMAVSVAIAMLLAFYVSSIISKPLTILTVFMNKAGSTGEISLSAEDEELIAALSQSKDEVGQCIGSTAGFIKHLHRVAKVLGSVADGDLTARLELLSSNDTMGLSLQKMTDSLNATFGEINSAANQVSVGSKQVSDGAQTLAQGATEQAASVQQLSGSINEVADKTNNNAKLALSTASMADTIKDKAKEGSEQMNHMIQAVKEINDASQNISKVIKAIDDIAFQTNILALNAAVEAARAGAAGKGFAVVAEEVRNLAVKSADAAKSTSEMIENSIEKARMGSQIAAETAASLEEIVSGINESTKMIRNIAQSSEEQSAAISQINIGIEQVAQVVQHNSATSEESAAASEEMTSQAVLMTELISRFRLRDNYTSSSHQYKTDKMPSKKLGSSFSEELRFTDGVSFNKY